MAKRKRTKMTKLPVAAPTPDGDRRTVQTVDASRCKKCGSTRRAGYAHVREIPFAGTTVAGQRYTHIVWRNTCCLECGQHRTDKSYECR